MEQELVEKDLFDFLKKQRKKSTTPTNANLQHLPRKATHTFVGFLLLKASY